MLRVYLGVLAYKDITPFKVTLLLGLLKNKRKKSIVTIFFRSVKGRISSWDIKTVNFTSSYSTS